MTAELTVIAAKILNKDYQFKCPVQEAESLKQALELVSQELNFIGQNHKIKQPEHVLVTLSVQLASQLQQVQQLQGALNLKLAKMNNVLQTISNV